MAQAHESAVITTPLRCSHENPHFSRRERARNGAPGFVLVHRSDIVGQGQGEFALPGGQRTGESSTTEDFYRGVVGEGEMVVGGFQSGGEGFQLLVAADELDGIDFRGRASAATQEDEEIGVSHLSGLAQFNGAVVLELVSVARDGGVGLGISTRERGQTAAGLGSWA